MGVAATLMTEAARSIGFAARFASGYLAVSLDDPQEPTNSSGRGSTARIEAMRLVRSSF
jgi:transglutaminase-like putative cysteine protease